MIRADLAGVEPYRWQEGWEEHVPADRPVLRLDQNTQPRPPAWYAGAAARLARVPVHSYPDSRYQPLRDAIAAYTGFPADQVIATGGRRRGPHPVRAAGALARRPGLRRQPCYGMFESATRLAGGVLADDPDGRPPALDLHAPQPHRRGPPAGRAGAATGVWS